MNGTIRTPPKPHGHEAAATKQTDLRNFYTAENPNKRPRDTAAPTSIDDLATIIMSQHEQVTAQLSKLDQLCADVSEIKTSHAETKEQVARLEETVEAQQKQIEFLTRERDFLLDESRKSNLLFHGIPESEKDPIQSVNNVLSKVGVSADVDTASRLGRPVAGKNRPIKVRLVRLSDRQKILTNKFKMKNFTPMISITEDLCLSTRIARKEAWERKTKQARPTSSQNMDF